MMTEQELIEALADAEHASWSRWMTYLFSTGTAGEHPPNEYPVVTLPSTLVARWSEQAMTPYDGLSEEEKQSDRDEVANILPVIRQYVADQLHASTQHPSHPSHPSHPHHHRHLKRTFVETLGKRLGALVGRSPQPHRDRIDDELFQAARDIVHDLFGLFDTEYQQLLDETVYETLREHRRREEKEGAG